MINPVAVTATVTIAPRRKKYPQTKAANPGCPIATEKRARQLIAYTSPPVTSRLNINERVSGGRADMREPSGTV